MRQDYAAVIDQRADVLDALHDALATETDLFGQPHIGPRDWQAVSYPASQLLASDVVYQGAGEYQHTQFTRLVWRYSSKMEYVADILRPTGRIIEACMAELEATDGVTAYVPAQVEDFAVDIPGASENNTTAVAISIQWEIQTVVDLAETSTPQ